MFLSAGGGLERAEFFRLLRSCQIHVKLLSRFQTLYMILNLRNCWTSANQSSHVKNMISWVLRGCGITRGNLRQSSSGKTSSVTSCESKGAWHSRTPPLAAGRWWSPPASRGTPLSGPVTPGRCRSKIPAGHSPDHAWSPEAWSAGRTFASSAQNCWDT